MQQLPLVLDTLARYDREPVDRGIPLTAREVAALEYHGYRLVEVDASGATFDTPDGRIGWDSDMWRSEIDVFYLIARQEGTGVCAA